MYFEAMLFNNIYTINNNLIFNNTFNLFCYKYKNNLIKYKLNILMPFTKQNILFHFRLFLHYILW